MNLVINLDPTASRYCIEAIYFYVAYLGNYFSTDKCKCKQFIIHHTYLSSSHSILRTLIYLHNRHQQTPVNKQSIDLIKFDNKPK